MPSIYYLAAQFHEFPKNYEAVVKVIENMDPILAVNIIDDSKFD